MGGALRPGVASAPHEASGAALHPAQPTSMHTSTHTRTHTHTHTYIHIHARTMHTCMHRERPTGMDMEPRLKNTKTS